MIHFPCKCGNRFELPADQAGGLVQCDRCGLLVDVPSMNDLASMHEDGTFAFDAAGPAVDPTTVADLHRLFTNRTADQYGNEKDLRSTVEELRLVGDDPAETPRVKPRYDPVTGELIRALQLKDDKPRPVLSLDPTPVVPVPVPPMARPAPRPVKSLGYAVGDSRKQTTALSLVVDLFQPGNTAVLTFVYFGALIGRIVLAAVTGYSERFLATLWPLLVVQLPMWLIVSHLGVVIEETGPDASDELPRPLRNLDFGEDIVGPFLKVMLAGLICFWPTVLAARWVDLSTTPGAAVFAGVFLAGCAIFPGVLLTAVTGTTILNLRPDRVIAVVRQCGPGYLLSVAAVVPTIAIGTYYLAGEFLFPQQIETGFFKAFNNPFSLFTLLGLFVCTLHWFGWHLGLMYRLHHADFPWLAQRHVKRERPARRTLNQF